MITYSSIDDNRPLTLEILKSQIPSRISSLRLGQQSAEKHGQHTIAKWYEGQADALERIELELERICVQLER